MSRKKITSILLLWIIGDPYFLIMNHLLYLLSTKYDKTKKICWPVEAEVKVQGIESERKKG